MVSIAIDGPAGAGKSTIAKAAAKELKYIYVDTGALYRTIALYALRMGLDTKNEEQIKDLLPKIEIDLKFEDDEQRVFLNKEDVTNYIRTPEVSMAASNVSSIGEVRSFLFDLQRNMAKTHNVIMDGRDIGTVVLPLAKVKIFLTASPQERANRRFIELKDKGMDVDYDSILEDIKTRDYNDSHRKIAPLIPANDALILDTTGETLEESIKRLIKIIKNRI